MAGDVQRDVLAFVGTLIRDDGCRGTAVAHLKLEGFAHGHSMRIGRSHRDVRGLARERLSRVDVQHAVRVARAGDADRVHDDRADRL